MGRKNTFIKAFFKAAAFSTWVKNPIKTYKAVANSPGFKAKRVLGAGLLGVTGGVALARKAAIDPEVKAMGKDY